jgi:HTTM domain
MERPGLLRTTFAVDPRSLAVFRIGAGLLILADLALRARFLSALYTDEGVFPRSLLAPEAWRTVAPFHLWGGGLAWEAFLFCVAGVFALLLVVGWRTRLASAASWLLLLSLHDRNPVITHYGDEIFRAVLFWAVFLPLGRCWSVDARRRGGAGRYEPVVSVASAAILLQMASVYLFSGLMKSGRDWHADGTALYYALHQDWRARPLGVLLREHALLVRLLTRATLALELLGPVALLSPWRNGPVRTAAVFALLAFHVGLGSAMYVGPLFPAMACVALSALLPPWFWERVEALRAGRGAPAAAAPAAPVGGAAAAARSAGRGVLALLLAYVLLYNVVGLWTKDGIPGRIGEIGAWLHLNQRWSMYTPNGPRDDGWYVVAGELADGRQLELGELGGEVRFRKPASLTAHHRPRFTLLLWRLHAPGTAPLRQRYGAWLCRSWNREHPPSERLERVRLYFMEERTPPPGRTPHVARRLLLDLACAAEAGS